MHRGSLLLALAAVLVLCAAVALAAPAPPVSAYMGSLDYGGQPPNYDYARIAGLANFPVDRRDGAPAPLTLGAATNGAATQQ